MTPLNWPERPTRRNLVLSFVVAPVALAIASSVLVIAYRWMPPW